MKTNLKYAANRTITAGAREMARAYVDEEFKNRQKIYTRRMLLATCIVLNDIFHFGNKRLTVNAVYGRMNSPIREKVIELTREFDEYELKKMREMRLGGSTLKAIAEYFGCSVDLISTRLRMMDITRQGFLDENLTNQVLSLRAEGMPYHEIARQLDLTASEMHRVRTAIRRSYDADKRKG